MGRKRRLAIGSVLIGGLVAAACGGDDGGGSGSAASIDANVKEGISSQLGGSSTTAGDDAAPQPTSIEEWEALWAEERAAIVARIQENGWGTSADGKTLTGPEGYTVDLSACPADWSNTEGLTDTTIKIGWPAPLSGAQADFAAMPKAAIAQFDHYNAEGAFTDSEGKTRNVEVVLRDDAYDTAKTIPLVDEMLDSERVFATATMISPGGLNTYDKVNQRCVPQFITTGHPAWGDPVNHPWTTGMLLSYSTEAILWGSYIEQNLDEWGGKAKVAALVMSNDFGRAYDSSFRAFLAQSPESANIEYVTETIEPQAPTLKDPMTTLAAQDPDVFIAMIAGAPCTQAITEAAENGMKESVSYLFMPSVCKAASFVGKDKVGGDGSASDGWWIIGGGAVDFNADASTGEAFVDFGRKLLSDAGIDYHTSGSFGSGFIFSWAMVQALQIADELEGGLSRTNLILAMRSMDMTHPLLLEGIKFNMNGNADTYYVEGSDIAQYDSAKQQWIQEGDIIELSGKSTPCAFDQASGTCA